MKCLWLVLALAACAPPTPVSYGEQLFNDPEFSGSRFNVFSCNTCHPVSDGDTRMLPGRSLVGAVDRPRYWGGQSRSLLESVSHCYVDFMRGAAPLQKDDPRSRALYAYLASLGGRGERGALPLTVVHTPKDVARAEASRGQQVYVAACKNCHGDKGTGAGRNSTLASVLPNVKAQYPALFPNVPVALVFIEKIRHGPYFGIGGNMPLFSIEALSDEDLGALLQYLEL